MGVLQALFCVDDDVCKKSFVLGECFNFQEIMEVLRDLFIRRRSWWSKVGSVIGVIGMLGYEDVGGVRRGDVLFMRLKSVFLENNDKKGR